MSGIIRADANTDISVFERLSALDRSAVGSEGWSSGAFRSEAEKENGYVLYIADGNEIIALLCGYSAVGEGDITSVAVAPDYRRRGLAKALIDKFAELLPDGTESIFLEVRESNSPAIALYEKCGFERLSLRKNFYDEPRENAVVMVKRF